MTKPIVICLSGLDPTGGAGISADIETLQMTDCHSAPLISSITSQNGNGFQLLEITQIHHLMSQLEAVLNEFKGKISVCKIGLIATDSQKEFIIHLRKKIPDIKIVFDPIMTPSSLKNEADFDNIKIIRNQLKNLGTSAILTPNKKEFFSLVEIKNNSDKVLNRDDKIIQKALNSYKTLNIWQLLISSINEVNQGNQIGFESWLACFNQNQKKWQFKSFFNQKIEKEFHGSGCTLASALAGFLAQKLDLTNATKKALDLSAGTLAQSKIEGINQSYPNRNLMGQA